MNRIVLPAAAIVLMAVAGYLYTADRRAPVPAAGASGAPIVQVTLPAELSEAAMTGQTIFDAACASCHGANAAGQDGVAPPLVHIIYEPGHHGDEAFQRAVAQGVQAHHWPFGDMPAVAGLTRADVAMVVVYVRELQQANGIR